VPKTSKLPVTGVVPSGTMSTARR